MHKASMAPRHLCKRKNMNTLSRAKTGSKQEMVRDVWHEEENDSVLPLNYSRALSIFRHSLITLSQLSRSDTAHKTQRSIGQPWFQLYPNILMPQTHPPVCPHIFLSFFSYLLHFSRTWHPVCSVSRTNSLKRGTQDISQAITFAV